MSKSRVLPTRGEALPEIAGATPDGSIIHISDFRGRKNIVLIFSGQQADGRIQKLIDALASRCGEVRNESAEIVAVIAEPSPKFIPPKCDDGSVFPTISDERNTLHTVIGAVASDGSALAAVCIADRYGEVYAAEFCADAGCLSVDDILEWLRFIEIQCPECGVPEWPRTAL